MISVTRNRRRGSGYTVVESMIAITLFAVTAAGAIAMQRAAVQGNTEARRRDVATSIARTWVDRLRRDATKWTLPGRSNRTITNFAQAKLLRPTGDTWLFPIEGNGTQRPDTVIPGDGLSGAFDSFGQDFSPGVSGGTADYTEALYCVQTRIRVLSVEGAPFCVGNPPDINSCCPPVVGVDPPITCAPRLLQADVRVVWRRSLLGDRSGATAFARGCAGVPATEITADMEYEYHFVQLTTTVESTPEE